MKAVVYDQKSPMGPIILREVAKPVPTDDQVLIRIQTSSINALDYRPLQMGFKSSPDKILGADVAGIVEAIGKKVQKFHPGDEVFGDISDYGSGAFADYVAVTENAVAIKPKTVSFQDAAAVPVAGITALQALRDKGRLKPHQNVLIHGSGGGVGTFAVQLAHYFGAEVTAVCSTQNLEIARKLGADHVIDYSQTDFTKLTNRYDLILAINGYHPLFSYRRVLAPKGVYVMVGGTLPQIAKSLLFGPLMSIGNRKFRSLMAKSNSDDLRFMIHLVEMGAVKPVIDRVFPLREIAEAFQYIEKGHSRGKIVVSIPGDESSVSAPSREAD